MEPAALTPIGAGTIATPAAGLGSISFIDGVHSNPMHCSFVGEKVDKTAEGYPMEPFIDSSAGVHPRNMAW